MKAFDLPLSMIKKDQFYSPMIGAKYLSGVLGGSGKGHGFQGEPAFKIWFMQGECNKI